MTTTQPTSTKRPWWKTKWAAIAAVAIILAAIFGNMVDDEGTATIDAEPTEQATKAEAEQAEAEQAEAEQAVAEASEPTNEEVVAALEEWAPEYAQHIQKLEVRNGYIHITYMDNREGDEWAGLGMVFVEPIRSEGWEVDTFEFAGPSGNIQNVYCSESRCATSKLNL